MLKSILFFAAVSSLTPFLAHAKIKQVKSNRSVQSLIEKDKATCKSKYGSWTGPMGLEAVHYFSYDAGIRCTCFGAGFMTCD